MTYITHDVCKGLNKSGLSKKDRDLINSLVCSQQDLLHNNEELNKKITDMLSVINTHYRAVDNGFTYAKSNAMIVDELNNLYDNICCLTCSVTRGFFLIPKDILILCFQAIKGGISGLFLNLKYPAQFAVLLKDLILRIVYTLGIRGHLYKNIEHLLDGLIDWVPDFLNKLGNSLTNDKVSTFKLIGLQVLKVLANFISDRRGWFKKLIGNNLDKIIDALPISNSTKAYLHNQINSNKEVIVEYIDVLIDTLCDEPEAFLEMLINYAILDNTSFIRKEIEKNNNNVTDTIINLTDNLLNYIDFPKNVKKVVADYICFYMKDMSDELNELYQSLISMQVSHADFSKRLANIIFGCIKKVIIYLNENHKELKIEPISVESLIKLIAKQSKKHINNSKYNTILGSADYLSKLVSSIVEIIKDKKPVDKDTLRQYYDKAVDHTQHLTNKMVDGFFEMSQENWAEAGNESGSEFTGKKIPNWKKRLKANINNVEHAILNFIPPYPKKLIYRLLFLINSILKLLCDNFGELIGVLLFLSLLVGVPLLFIIIPLLILSILALTALALTTLALVSAAIGALIGALISGLIFGILGLLAGTIFGFGVGSILGFTLGFITGSILGFIIGLTLGFIAGFALGLFLGVAITTLISLLLFSLLIIGFLLLSLAIAGASFLIGLVGGALLGVAGAYLWRLFFGTIVRTITIPILFIVCLIIMFIVAAIVGAIFNAIWLPFSIFLLNAFPGLVVGQIPVVGPIIGFFGSTLGTALQAIGAFIASLIYILIGMVIIFVLIYLYDLVLGFVLL